MIRKMEDEDIDKAAKIWLDTNVQTHHFIPEKYWKDNYEAVKTMLPLAEVYVYEAGNSIQGFIGLDEDYIAGIFVQGKAQSCGIGKRLLDFVKSRKKQLSLNVYLKNVRAVSFYEREGFKILRENIDQGTGEREYVMIWEKRANRI